uniref:Uncharacterized protein n=1 Tax=Amphimedon queenslandica TaxID=400682 RepID=A0A1X7UDD2_AMPQE
MATSSSESIPPSKKRRLALSLFKKKSEESFTIVEDDELEVAKGVVPFNTKNNTWAVQNFNNWSMSRNSRLPDDHVPPNLYSFSYADECLNGCVSSSRRRVKSQASRIHHPHCMPFFVAYMASVDSVESSSAFWIKLTLDL